ncbi:MAG: ABC transporter ATP-binding protein [Rickettsiales bacterium]|nr:ABC transporter ATP-binding protein [Rickettsiales bacterium]
MSNIVLKLSNINKFFTQGEQKIEVIKNGNLEIKESELVALVGPSGSGKTTLLQIAGLLDNPNSGTIEINNRKVNQDDQSRTEIRKNNIGFIYQFHHLLPEFNALENVALPLLVQGRSKQESFHQAQNILKEVELEDRSNHKPSELSGGQQQRVAIARAIVTKPSLILADEPTGNLDYELSGKIFNLFLKLVKSHKIACLIVTHNKELSKKADRVLEIEKVNNS